MGYVAGILCAHAKKGAPAKHSRTFSNTYMLSGVVRAALKAAALRLNLRLHPGAHCLLL